MQNRVGSSLLFLVLWQCEIAHSDSTQRVEIAATSDAASSSIPKWAIDAAANGRFAEALPAYKFQVQLEPENASSRVDLALILLGANQVEQALVEVRTAIRLSPNLAEAHHALSIIYLKAGMPKEAVAALREAVRLKPDDATYLCDLGVALVNATAVDQGVNVLKRAIALDPTCYRARVELGKLLHVLGHSREAIGTFTDALAIKDTDEARLGRAAAYRRSGRFLASIADCDHILRDDPTNHKARAFHAFANLRLGNIEEAERDAERVVATGREYNDIAHVVFGYVRLTQGDADQAVIEFTKAIDSRSGDPLPFVLRAVAYCRRLELDKCVADLDPAIQRAGTPQRLDIALDSFGWQAYKLRGLAKLLLKRDVSSTIDDFTRALELNDGDAECRVLRAVAYAHVRNWSRASDDLEKSLLIAPDHPLATLYLAHLLASCPEDRVRNGQRAIELATKACEKTNWKNSRFLQALAAAYSETGDFVNASTIQSAAMLRYREQGNDDTYTIRIWWDSKLEIGLSTDEDDAVKLLKAYKERIPSRIACSRLSNSVLDFQPVVK